jgi:hypothetical protein
MVSRKGYYQRIEALQQFFDKIKGWLEDDRLPGKRWNGVITSRINLLSVTVGLDNFDVDFKTQPFPEDIYPNTGGSEE